MRGLRVYVCGSISWGGAEDEGVGFMDEGSGLRIQRRELQIGGGQYPKQKNDTVPRGVCSGVFGVRVSGFGFRVRGSMWGVSLYPRRKAGLLKSFR